MVFSQYSPGMIPGWGIWLGQPQDLLFDAEQSFFSVYFPVPPHRNQVNNYVSSFRSGAFENWQNIKASIRKSMQ